MSKSLAQERLRPGARESDQVEAEPASPSRLLGRFAYLLALIVMVSFVGGVPALVVAQPAAAASAHAGGTLKVYEDSVPWPNLDPALDPTDLTDAAIMDAIYGQLFNQGPHDRVVPDLATGYKFVTNNQLDIYLRPNVTFQDGSTLTSSVVVWNIDRDLLPANGCICDGNFSAVSSVSTQGPDTVVLHLSRPFFPLVAAFINEAPNWIASEKAVDSMGTVNFGQRPVGAGPFEVVSNEASTSLVLKAFPKYWQKGRPLLQGLVFTAVSNPQSGYSGQVAGEAGMSLFLMDPTVAHEASKSSSVRLVIPVSSDFTFLYFNEHNPEMSNLKVRELLSYATNPKGLESIFTGGYGTRVEGVEAPGQLFYDAHVDGYRGYDLTKAKALLKELGGKLSVTLISSTTAAGIAQAEAVASQWEQAGVHVTLDEQSEVQLIQDYARRSYQVTIATWAGYDPGIALPIYFASTGSFSQVTDPSLDALLERAAATANSSGRQALYKQVYSRIDQQAYAVPLFATPQFWIVSKSVDGVTNYNEFFGDWQNLSLG